MWRLIIVTFAFMGLAFYELSGGSDFQPPERADASPVTVTPLATTPVIATSSSAEAAPRKALTTASNVGQAPRDEIGDAQVIQASLDMPIAKPRRANALFEVVGQAPRRAEPKVVAEAEPARVIPAGFGNDVRIVAKPRVNMRGGPGTNYDVVAKLNDGDVVDVIEDNGDGWVKLRVTDSGEIGWMADFLLTAAN